MMTTPATPTAPPTIDLEVPQLACGEAGAVQAGEPIPDKVWAKDVIIVIPGNQSQLFRVVETDGDRITLSNLAQRQRRSYTRTELDAIRPLGFVIPDRGWRQLHRFVEGGIYQMWPTGRVYKVQNGFLLDAARGARIYGTSPAERKAIPRLLPVMIPRWLPPAAPTPADGDTE